jgi:drug/metabolite transporter (DMT)-like permease
MQELRQEQSIGALLGQLGEDMALLVRQEAQLAKVEMQAKVSGLTQYVSLLATGGLLAWTGLLAITAAVVLLLIDPVGLKPWLAALLVGAVLGIAGYVMLQRGMKNLKNTDPTPRRTVETIRDDIQWAKEQRP